MEINELEIKSSTEINETDDFWKDKYVIEIKEKRGKPQSNDK